MTDEFVIDVKGDKLRRKKVFSNEEIKKRAYEISQKYPNLTPEQNWYAAKAELELEDIIQRGEVNE